MKILHIVPLSPNLLLPLVQMLNKYDKENEHTFLVTVTFASVLKNAPRMLCIRGLEYIPSFKHGGKIRRMLFLLHKARQADHVVWHSFRTNRGYSPFLLYLDKRLLKKSTWILADGEIGNYTNVSSRFLNHFTKYVHRYVQMHIAHIGVCFPPDGEVLEESSGVSREKIVTLPYPIPEERVELLRKAKDCQEPYTNQAGPLIQIGMSSQSGNFHVQVIKRIMGLTEYRPACVFLPFQYAMQGMTVMSGTKAYRMQLRKWLKKLRCRSICLEKCVSPHVFMRYLDQLDAIFLANQTVCRLELLFHLLVRGKKIFLPKESVLYRYLNQMEADIQPLESLERGYSLDKVLDCPRANLPEELAGYFEEETMVRRWIGHFSTLAAE